MLQTGHLLIFLVIFIYLIIPTSPLKSQYIILVNVTFLHQTKSHNLACDHFTPSVTALYQPGYF